MRTKQLESIIEAILFTMGDSVEVSKIASAIEQDVPTTEKLIHNMMDSIRKRSVASGSSNWIMHISSVANRRCMSI